MDKAERALIAADDNAAHIARLGARLAAVSRKANVCVALGAFAESGSETCICECNVSGAAAVAVRFDGGAAALMFDGTAVAYGASPLFAMLPEGSGRLRISARRGNVSALLIGDIAVTMSAEQCIAAEDNAVGDNSD